MHAFHSIGFSLGDELGFPESLGNVEGSKKRSLDVRTIGKGNSIGYTPDKMPVSENANNDKSIILFEKQI